MQSLDFTIDQYSPLPYYFQLECYLKQEIERGRWVKGDELPSEGEVSSMCEVSLGVVRQAFSRLEKNGLITRQKGKRATVISDPKIQLEFMGNIASYYTELKSKGFKVKTKVMENHVITPTEQIASNLEIDVTQQVINISRLRFVEDKPIVYTTSYLSATLCPGIDKEDLSDKSLYETLFDKYGLKPKSAERSFEVVMGEQYVCNLLKIHAWEPIILIRWISYLENEEPMEYYEGWHTTGNWKFTFHSNLK